MNTYRHTYEHTRYRHQHRPGREDPFLDASGLDPAGESWLDEPWSDVDDTDADAKLIAELERRERREHARHRVRHDVRLPSRDSRRYFKVA